MKKIVLYFISFFLLSEINAQQFPQYTQFIFNKIGYNPAASGTSINAPYELIFGARTQWFGFANNPKSAFVSFNYNFVPKRGYTKWHNVGVYVDQDQAGNFVHNDIWLSYTFHLLMTKKTIISFGLFAGVKQFKLTRRNLDGNDPAVANSSGSLWAYPDLVPGIRLTNKKFFMDVCFQQVSVFKQSGLGGTIGSPSKLLPHYNFSAGRKFKINDFDKVMVAVNVRSSVLNPPSVELNIINYYNKRFALGASLRSKNFLAAIVQFRMLHNLNVGLAYDLSINKAFRGSPNTAEIMVSFSPLFGGEMIEKITRYNVSDCTF
ncbi:MAG: PorP/SprF family type IX secretion system membrane protein [Bacteroidia bacterium]|nr:PorP/SprF family type IX secretion system membrane protein [Bacteroidia bacterium]